MGTASAGPLAIGEERLTQMVARIVAADTPQVVH